MTDDLHHKKELHQHRIGNVIALLLVIVVAGAGAVAYKGFREMTAQSKEQTEALNAQTAALKAERTRKIDADRQALYARVTEAAAKAAEMKRAGTEQQFADAVAQYKVLYNGPAAMEKNTEACEAMGLFNRALDAYADAPALEKLSLDLAHVCGGVTAGQDLSRNAAPSSVDPGLGILTEMTELVYGAEAQFAALKWLDLVDAEKYAESWKAASASLQSFIPQERWERAAFRKPYGSMLSRKPRSADYSKSSAGMPDGNYVVVQFDTSFAGKQGALETVTMTLEQDGKWRASAYNIK